MVATSPSGAILTLQLGDTSSGFYVQEFTGLDPVKATIQSSAFANQDGGIFQSARRDVRNITIKIGLDPDPAVNTVRGLRTQIYNIFSPKTLVSMKFYVDDTDDAAEDGYLIYGYVESCLSAMFAQEPVVDISILCMDPDFIDPVAVNVTTLTTADAAATYFPYAGNVNTGFVFTLNVANAISEFILYYVDANLATHTMDVQASLLTGDQVTISTVPGNKYINLKRSGVISSLLYAVPLQATWPQLAPGDNWLRVYSTGPANTASVTYNKRFGGL
jgi:hypothetical protein